MSASASLWDWSLASAGGLLTNEECSMLLETDFLENDLDLLKTFPSAAPKVGTGLSDFGIQDDTSASMYPPSPPESKPSRSQLANDLLQQLETQCKQENIFSNWLEEKVDLPIFEAIPERVDAGLESPAAPAAVPVAHYPPHHPQPTDELLREFESVYGAVELTHLTPPHSPPGPATQLLLSYAQQAAAPAPLAPPLPIPHQWNPTQDYERELQAVDELVRDRAAELASPHSSAPSSPRSSTDEDWSSSASSSRPKPYSRNPDDRRSRKKEQNKNAATRYRQKKKAEVEVLLSEEHSLRLRHNDLDSKCSDLQREIRYLKGLMRDLFKAKGLIK